MPYEWCNDIKQWRVSLIEAPWLSNYDIDSIIEQYENKYDSFKFLGSSPIDFRKRGSQVSFTHPNGFPIMQALISRGFIGDFRHPNILRFGISPLYMKFEDIWNLVKHLKEIMKKKEWEYAKFKKKKVVT